MKEKIYILLIALLAALSVFLLLTLFSGRGAGRHSGEACVNQGLGGHGMRMGTGRGREMQAARRDLLDLIKTGSRDTVLLYERLENIVNVQRENQKNAILRILAIRDSLSGEERGNFLKRLDEGFCRRGTENGDKGKQERKMNLE